LIAKASRPSQTVLWKKSIPVNDGGIALGQAAIAAAIIES
jgi:hydrogenase maturation factor HypF (carbamoyltransferase family)